MAVYKRDDKGAFVAAKNDQVEAVDKLQQYAESYAQAWEDSAKLAKIHGQTILDASSQPPSGDSGVGPNLRASFGSEVMGIGDPFNDETQYRDRDDRVIRDSQDYGDMGDDTQSIKDDEDSDEEIHSGIQHQFAKSSSGPPEKCAVSSGKASKAAKPFCQTVIFQNESFKKVKAQGHYGPSRATIAASAGEEVGSSGRLQQREAPGLNSGEELAPAPGDGNIPGQPKPGSRPLMLHLNSENAAQLSKNSEKEDPPISLEYPGMMTDEWLGSLQLLTQEVLHATTYGQKDIQSPSTPTAKRQRPSKGHFPSPRSAGSSGREHISKYKIVPAASSLQRRVTGAESVFESCSSGPEPPKSNLEKHPHGAPLDEKDLSIIGPSGSSPAPGKPKSSASARGRHPPGSFVNYNAAAFHHNRAQPNPHDPRAGNATAISHNRNRTPPPRPTPDARIFSSAGRYNDDDLNRNANCARRIIRNSPLGARFAAINAGWSGVGSGVFKKTGSEKEGAGAGSDGQGEERRCGMLKRTPLCVADEGVSGAG